MDEFMGVIKLFAGNFAPQGWMFCQGQTLSINQNQALFSIIGTTYGGNGQATFALPDLRGRVPVGFGQEYNLGQNVGDKNVMIAPNNLPSNAFRVSLTGLSVEARGASVEIPVSNDASGDPGEHSPSKGVLGVREDEFYAAKSNNQMYSGKPIPVDLGAMSVTGTAKIEVTGGGNIPVSIMQPSLGLNYIICVEGIYPSRS
jgi:microcystin-dependent protein